VKLIPRTAAFRIGLLTAIAYAVATALVGVAVHYAVHTAFLNQLKDSIDQAQVGLFAEYRDDGMDGLIEAIAIREARLSSVLGFAIFDRTGRRISGQLDTQMPAPGWREITFRDPVEGPDPAIALVTQLDHEGTLVVAADLEPLELVDEIILAVFGVAFLVLIAMGSAFAFGLGRYLTGRLDAIAIGSRAFAAGALSQRAVVGDRGDEFDQLAVSINAMLDRIEALLTNLRQVTSDLAHDMRTPLTRLRNDLEDLARAPLDARTGRIDQAVARCDDILRLFASILRISELEGGDVQAHFKSIDLDELVRDLAEAHGPLAEESGKSIVLRSLPGPALVTGDRDLLAQAMVNLIENALRHSPDGGTILVGLIKGDGSLSMQVRDQGPGIAEEDRERVTGRFYRLEAARNTPGFGLGLALVKAVATAHGGRLVLGDAQPGLDARIVLPARSEP
jgi:signal transduction histidine kinase